MKKVTIRDVASIAGVSISTVSRVIAGKNLVNPATVLKVQEAIEQTGFQPNYTARALATKSTDTIGVIIDRAPALSLKNSYFVNILESIATELSKYEKDMLLLFADEKENHREDERVRRLINSKKIDGVIKLSVKKDDKTIRFLQESETPTVVIGSPDDQRGIICVDNDNVKAMKSVIEYLINQGNKKIAYVGGNFDYIVSQKRKLGYELAMSEHKLPFGESDIYFTDFTIDSGYEIAKDLLHKDYDAIACTDDLIAVGIANRYLEEGKTINLSGFNNTYYAAFSKLPITTVDINVNELGFEAVEQLINKLNNNHYASNSFIETNIITREI